MHDFNFWHTLFTIVGVFGVILGTCALLIFVERKIAAWVQDRLGPNRVGPHGLFQSIADGLKFLLKEDIIPKKVDKVLYLLAPCIALSTALLAFAAVPFGPTTPPPKLKETPVSLRMGPSTKEHAEAQQKSLEHYERDLAEYRSSYQFVIAPGIDIGIVFIFAVTSLAVYAIILGGWAANNKY